MFNIASEIIRGERLACQPEKLRLRLMGIKMSTLKRHQSDEKSIQDKVTRYFNKHDENPSQSQLVIKEVDKNCDNIEKVTCPVCNQFHVCKTDDRSWLALLNSHIDNCLQQPEIMKASISCKDSAANSKEKVIKRRKQQRNRMHRVTGNRTLHNFWHTKDNFR